MQSKCMQVTIDQRVPVALGHIHVQVEYQFSDINLVANEFLLKIMNKDTEGYGK